MPVPITYAKPIPGLWLALCWVLLHKPVNAVSDSRPSWAAHLEDGWSCCPLFFKSEE